MKTATRSTTVTVELPENLVASIGSPEATAEKMREALVLQLLREVRITQGQAAQLLGITRWDVLQLMAKNEILSGPVTTEETRQEIETALTYGLSSLADGSR